MPPTTLFGLGYGTGPAGYGYPPGARRPSISYPDSPFTWYDHVEITAALPTNGGGPITNYSVLSGSLPDGVSLNATTGELTGTPTTQQSAASVVIRARGPGGVSDTTISVEVLAMPLSLGSSLAAWYRADAGCYTDAACLFASASSQYLSKTSPTFAPTTKMTIRLWVKFTSLTTNHGIVGRMPGQFLLWVSSSNNLIFSVSDGLGGYFTVSSVNTLSAGVEYDIVLVYDGTLSAADRVSIYINGVSQALGISTIPSSLPASSDALAVSSGAGVSAGTNGALARLGFSSQALSGAALTAAHTSTFWADMTAARQADWFSFYNLCEASGTRVDSTGLNDLTPTNGPTVAAGPGEGLAVNNSPVKRWESRVGSLHLTQSDITKQPLWIASAQNGLPAVRDDGVDDVFASFAHGASSTLALLFAAKAAGSASDGAFLFSGGTGSHYIGDYGTGSTWGYYPTDTSGVKDLGAGATTSWQAVLWSYESTSVVRASVSSQSEVTTDPDHTLGSGLTVFSGLATPPIEGDIGEAFLIADNVPTLAVRNSARAYLRQRWNTP